MRFRSILILTMCERRASRNSYLDSQNNSFFPLLEATPLCCLELYVNKKQETGLAQLLSDPYIESYSYF